VRVIKLDASHLSGSGEWEIALGYVCSENQIRKVLEQKSVSSVVISQKGNTLSVTVWEEYRGAAPPQGKKRRSFQWVDGKFISIVTESNRNSH
jgi:hypothetical protein